MAKNQDETTKQKLQGKMPGKKASMQELVDFYNANSGTKPITEKKFKGDLELARVKCEELQAAVIALSGTVGTKGKPKKEKAEGEAGEAGKGRKSSNADKLLTTTLTENPRRAGTFGHTSFAIILKAGAKGIRYEDYIAAGGRSNDLAWDVTKGNVIVG